MIVTIRPLAPLAPAELLPGTLSHKPGRKTYVVEQTAPRHLARRAQDRDRGESCS